MSIKITWTSLKSVPDTLTIYWSDTAFTPNNLPSNSAVIPPASTSYTDTTIPVNSIRYYMVKATKAGLNDMYSQCLVQGHYPNTGPGSNQILRGDWNLGLMDILTPAQMFTVAGLKTALGLATSWGGTVNEATVTAWYKFIYKGKILFIPNATFSNASSLRWPDIYNNGLIYGVDGPGVAPFDLVTGGLAPAVAAPVNQKKVVKVGVNNFLVRAPRLSTLPTSTELPADTSSFVDGEWWETMCRMGPPSMMAAADLPNMAEAKWGDLQTAGSLFTCAATPHFLANKIACCVSNGNWSGYIGRNTTQAITGSWVNWVPVLEYIGPDEGSADILTNVELFGTLPAAVANFQAGIGSNRIHVFAGQTSGPTHRQVYSRLTKDTKTWANSANIAALSWGGGCYCGDSFYAGGGTNATAYTNAFWKLNPDTGAGSNLANIPGALRGQAKFVAISPTVLHMVGGYEISAGKTSALHYKYDTAANTWTLLAPLPLSLNGHSAGAYNGKLYVMGGYNETAGNSGDVREYDPTTNTWTVIGTAPINSSWVGGCVYKNYVIMAIVQNGLVVLQIFDVITKKWFRNETGISQRWAMEMVADDSGVYILGGVNSNTVGSGTWYTATRYADVYRVYD